MEVTFKKVVPEVDDPLFPGATWIRAVAPTPDGELVMESPLLCDDEDYEMFIMGLLYDLLETRISSMNLN